MFSPAHHKRPSDSSNVMGSPQRAGRTAGTAGAGAGTSSLEGPPWCLLVHFWENSLETALVEHIEPPISSAQPLSQLVAGQCPAIPCFLQTDTQIRVHCVNHTYDLYTNKDYWPCFPPMFAFFWKAGSYDVIWVILQAPKNLALGAVGSSSNFGGVLASLLASWQQRASAAFPLGTHAAPNYQLISS